MSPTNDFAISLRQVAKGVVLFQDALSLFILSAGHVEVYSTGWIKPALLDSWMTMERFSAQKSCEAPRLPTSVGVTRRITLL